jgi:uncharacterized membrane protein
MQETDFYKPPADQGPLPPAGPSRGDGAPVPWEPTGVISSAWEVVKEHWLALIFATLIATWVPAIPSWILNSLKPGSAANVALWFAGVVIQIALGAFFGVGLCRMLVAGARREPIEFAALVEGGAKFWKMLGADMLVGLVSWALVLVTTAPAAALAAKEMGIDAFTDMVVFQQRMNRLTAAPVAALVLGSLVLLVLSVLVTLRLHFASFYVADAGRGPAEALGASWAATEGQVGQLFVFAVLSWLLSMAGLCACCIGIFPMMAVLRVAHAVIYTRISGRVGEAPETP